ncbi:MAG TPA: cupin domain-containing protein [Candidatus Dormibacteraeota bacterium]|jgi:quercetin dioxygenase-like cupin family protein|nr:cupin domain-containing protein [Candidatus Dormibacteraeota bacterium]
MGLLANGAEMGVGRNVLPTKSGGMVTKSIYGSESSLMVVTREAGYHSRPHRHRSEQLNYIVDGEIWVFVEEEVFLARAGDFYRIPSQAVHWGWNRSDRPVTTFQSYAPALDPYTRGNSVPLLVDGETVRSYCQTEYLASEDLPRYEEIEERWLRSLEGRG